jgi:hypothetical protein
VFDFSTRVSHYPGAVRGVAAPSLPEVLPTHAMSLTECEPLVPGASLARLAGARVHRGGMLLPPGAASRGLSPFAAGPWP